MLFGSSLTVFADEGEEYYHYGSNISNIGNTEINASISQIPTQISQTLTHNPNGNTPSSNSVEEPTKIEEVHEHSYSWVTVQEASAGQDGIEEYRCSCGAVAERSDVTTIVTFEYNKTAYRLTIPAGADCSALLADEDYFYGYFYFAQLVGATIEEV